MDKILIVLILGYMFYDSDSIGRILLLVIGFLHLIGRDYEN